MMFDKYLLFSDLNRIQTKLGISKLTCSSKYIPSYNIGFGDVAYVIANYQTKELQQFKFGLKCIGDDIKYSFELREIGIKMIIPITQVPMQYS